MRARSNLRILNINKHQMEIHYQNTKKITSTGRTHKSYSGKGVNILKMRFNGKSYDNVQFTSIGENKERGWSHDCLRIALNVMFTQMSAKKGITLFKDHAFAATVKEYKQLDGMDVMGPENPNVITPKQKQK